MMSKDRRIIRIVLSFIIFGSLAFIGTINPNDIKLYGCGFKKITGYDCPTCGITRSIHSAAQLRFEDSFHFNPLGIGLFIFLVLLLIKLILEISLSREFNFNIRPNILKIFTFCFFGFWLFHWIVKTFL